MTVTFCGHSYYQQSTEDESIVLSLLNERSAGADIEFFLGEYGEFDRFAYGCAKKFKKTHPSAKLIFVSPYLGREKTKDTIELQARRFDLTLYPPIEHIPLRYAILHRNRWMIEQADLVIAYVKYHRGGAHTSYQYAKRMGREIYNLASNTFE